MATVTGNEIVADPLPQAKPPFLRRVRIRGYKSIAFCDVTLEPLTILVGRNGSGKSNFLDALAFLLPQHEKKQGGAQTLAELVRAYARLGDNGMALKILEELGALGKDSLTQRLDLGKDLVSSGDDFVALAVFSQILAADPANAWRRLMRMWFLPMALSFVLQSADKLLRLDCRSDRRRPWLALGGVG